MKNIRTIAAGTILSLGLITAGAGQVAADAPFELTDSVTFPHVNPCTGAEIDVTINSEVREHRGHQNNFVAHISRTGTTSDGYVMDHAVESFQVNKNVARGSFNDIWRNEEGSMWRVSGKFVDKRIGGLQVENITFECVQP
jgi:hypothetical protein